MRGSAGDRAYADSKPSLSITREEVLKLLKAGRDGVRGWNAIKAGLAELPSLAGICLHNADGLDGVDLSGINLAGADLSGAMLEEANFARCNLVQANLSNSMLHGASFAGANLQRANLGNAGVDRTNFSGANLSGAYLPVKLWGAPGTRGLFG